MHRRRSISCSHFRRCPALGPAIFANLRVFILNLYSYVEVNDLQAEIFVTDKVVGLDVSMRYFVLVKICEALDEAQAKLNTTRCATTDQEYFVADRVQLW